MKKKGFTLVELLAVIVILAVIALIAVPVVLNMIEEARIGSAEDSVYSYVKGIEDSIVTGYLSGNEYDAGEYNVGDIKVNVKGSTPTNGSYELDSKNEVISGKFCINGYSIDYDGKHATRNKNADYCTNIPNGPIKEEANSNVTYKGIAYLDPTDLTKTCNASNSVSTTGTKTGCMKWYIYDDSNDKYKMILDHNTTAIIKWNDANNNVLYEDSNVKPVVDDLKISSSWKAEPRLISVDEIIGIIGEIPGLNIDDWTAYYYFDSKTSDAPNFTTSRSKYDWLFNNTAACRTGVYRDYGCSIEDNNEYEIYGTADTNKMYGYWTSTIAGPANSGKGTWSVSNGSIVINHPAYAPRGIRPVIEVSKNIFK